MVRFKGHFMPHLELKFVSWLFTSSYSSSIENLRNYFNDYRRNRYS